MYTKYNKQCYQRDKIPHYRFKWGDENFQSFNFFGMTKNKHNSNITKSLNFPSFSTKKNRKLLKKIRARSLTERPITFVIPSHTRYHYVNFGSVEHTNRSLPTSIGHFHSPNVGTTHKQFEIKHFHYQFKQIIVKSVNAICLNIIHGIYVLEQCLIRCTLWYLKRRWQNSI